MGKNKIRPGLRTLGEGIKKLTSVSCGYFWTKLPESHQWKGVWLQTKNTILRILIDPLLKDYITGSDQPFRHGFFPSKFSRTG